MTRRKRSARGYTAVELLMSIGILGVGVTGVVAMQKVTVTSNQHAKNLAIATQIGQAWMEQLRLDALQWVGADSTVNPPSTTWLGAHLPTAATLGTWSLPVWSDTRQFGPAFNALGAPFNSAADNALPAAFCVNLRLTRPFVPTSTLFAREGLIRTEVRVYWLRDGQGTFGGDEDTPPAAFCSEDPTLVGAFPDRYHMVYDVSAVRQNLFQ